jgi:DNA (cytosine-5)-methyltransferase 1
MENVPRVAAIIEAELESGGRLAHFRHLDMRTAVLNLEDFGIPQRRRRCFVGNLNFDLLKSYSGKLPKKTLGEVVSALSKEFVTDPLFGVTLIKSAVRDNEPEEFLDEEERRINEAGKLTHPVYNAMPFPDPLDRSVRTLTATCTRVSRESVIIEDPDHAGCYRRLTVRERACLQGFPITYQFYGTTYAQKLRMVGNAVPPAFAFLVGHTIRETPTEQLPALCEVTHSFSSPTEPPPSTKPERFGRYFPAKRTFRFAIPNLRLKSGVRFELVNLPTTNPQSWSVRFYFGTSKDICQIDLTSGLHERIMCRLSRATQARINDEIARLSDFMARADLTRMQAVWSHRGPGGTRPFAVLDELGAAGATLMGHLAGVPAPLSMAAVNDALIHQFGKGIDTLPGVPKLLRNARLIHAGMIVGTTANIEFGKRLARDDCAPRRARR